MNITTLPKLYDEPAAATYLGLSEITMRRLRAGAKHQQRG